ncbi:transglycosylase domain-containing protein [Natribacillus halophilus]|uniref:Penicillin-binding protein, 1A family n=1 Tax=Natribacillus halophilus TaxID=549003 RepID=A0A1G8L041_9BACI|nr:transglycosylase domain-containing protein [Natribacillus halophilus]SDI48520.1 penicillin-binding protein, 1A family [Natribacillus halophilus]
MEIATRQQANRRRSKWRWLFRLTLGFGILGAFILLVIFGLAYMMGPPPMETSQSTTIYSDEREVINEQHQGQQREWTDLDDVSPHVMDAFVAVEDRKFYDHHGFDYTRIGAAVLNNVRSLALSEGASTITQQYARNLFLSHDQTWDRKIREAFYTLRLEWHVPKEDILAGYINTINFGHGAYGIEQAAQMYFDIPASELNAAQSALLAGLPRGPSYYSPYSHPDRAEDRQQLILSMMNEQDALSQAEYEEALAYDLTYESEEEEEQATSAPYFQDTVERELVERYDLDPEVLEAGGLNIYTTLDPDLQEAAERYVEAELPKDDPLQGAAVSIDPRNGDVKAMVGGKDYNESPFNRAVDAQRAPGSVFKPFLYYAALENGFTAATPLKSEPTSFPDPDGDQSYEPGNFNENYANDFITMAQAMAYSDNIYAVKTNVLQEPDALVETAQAAGIESPLSANLSLALGTSEVNVLELTNAYSPFANGGERVDHRLVERVEDHDGNVLLETEPEREQVFNPDLSYIATDMMKEMFNPTINDYASVTGHSIAHLLQRPAAGKSGSTPSDSWMVGYTPQLVTGVWVGYDDNTALDHGEHGQIAKRIWVNALESGLQDELKQDFSTPDGVEEVNIDLETGLLADEACGPSYTVAFQEDTEPEESCVEYLDDEEAEEDAHEERKNKEKEKLTDKLKRWFGSDEVEM